MVVVRGRVVDVARHPHHVADPPPRDVRQHVGDLPLAAERRAGIAVGHRLEGLAVGDGEADRHVAGDDLPRRPRRRQRVPQPPELRAPEDVGGRGAVGVVRGAVRAQVEDEDVERRAVVDDAVDPLAGDGRVFEEGAARPRRQQRHVLHRVARVVVALARVPVVQHLVVVPLHDPRHLGPERAQRRVEQVVAVVAAELVQGLRDLALGRGGHVAPHRAVVEALLGRDGVVGVDRVPGMDEEVGPRRAHGVEDREPAAGGIDPPALARPRRRPRRTRRRPGRGRRAEGARPPAPLARRRRGARTGTR